MLQQHEKDALADFFQNRELYDPAKDPEQATPSFLPKELCDGGEAYCDGGVAGMSQGGIAIKPSHEGRLHEKLHVPEGQPIPKKKLAKAENSSSPALRKEAQFAENAKHWQHKARGGPIKMDDGGPVPGEGFAGPDLSADTGTVSEPIPPASGQIPNLNMSSLGDLKDGLANILPQTPKAAPVAAPMPTPAAPAPVPAAPAGKDSMMQDLNSYFSKMDQQANQFGPSQQEQQVEALKGRQKLANETMTPLAVLADAIMQGVARAGNPGFASSIRQQQQNALENAETEGAKLNEEQQQAVQQNMARNAMNPANLLSKAEQKAYGPLLEKAGVKPQDMAFISRADADKLLSGSIGMQEATARIEEAKAALGTQMMDAINSQMNQVLAQIAAHPLQSLADSNSIKALQAQYQQLAMQKMGLMRQFGSVPAAPGLPALPGKPMTATNRQTGQRIVSTDGGQTWKPIQ